MYHLNRRDDNSNSSAFRNRAALSVVILVVVAWVEIYTVETTYKMNDFVRDVQRYHRGYSYKDEQKTESSFAVNAGDGEDLEDDGDGDGDGGNIQSAENDSFNSDTIHVEDSSTTEGDVQDSEDGGDRDEHVHIDVTSENENAEDDNDASSNLASEDESDKMRKDPLPQQNAKNDEIEIGERSTDNTSVEDKTQSTETRGIKPSDSDANSAAENWQKIRKRKFPTWFDLKATSPKLVPGRNLDKDGPILDFLIIGYPKCGTTTVMANLAKLAPMPIADLCFTASSTVWGSYKVWPREHGGPNKTLHGSKCPQFIEDKWLVEYSQKLPRTKLILGIRHPLSWFVSFWNMMATSFPRSVGGGPYNFAKPCAKDEELCRYACPGGKIFCVHRGRFHLSLAALGKTELTNEERKLLAPNDSDGGKNLKSNNVTNPVFVYEQTQLKEDYVWEEMASYLNIPEIPHDKYVSSHGKNKKDETLNVQLDLCVEEYDDFRAQVMSYAYELAVWMQDYFIPLAKDDDRRDVVIPRPDLFHKLMEDYKKDPCGRLIRSGGVYILDKNLTTPAGK